MLLILPLLKLKIQIVDISTFKAALDCDQHLALISVTDTQSPRSDQLSPR
jgi:hypothetical protein